MIFQHSIWHFREENADLRKYSDLFQTEDIVTRLLLERGITSYEEAQTFLNPSIAHLHDPFLLKGMTQAVEAIHDAIKNGKSIWIYGDYDVDGITSISVMMKYFEFVNYKANYYIPSRQEEGYGLSEMGLDYIKNQGGDLVITVDCGITANAQALYAKDLGVDLIITDHHECQDELPEAIAVINPKIEGYPFKMLAGCGVAFKLTQALLSTQFEAFYPKVIDIVALGTVADIVPLVDENRIFTKIGLEQMLHTQNPGIQALIEEAQLQGKEINSGHIGFIIAPRINASGRIGNPSIAVEMLLEKDYYNALEIAKALSELNLKRQEQERSIIESAEAYIRTSVDLYREKILLVMGNDWHTGIIGIVASKLADKYSRPVVVLNIEDGYAKGSARSVEGISIFAVLSQFKDLFDKFGGHDQAAGLSLPLENLVKLKAGLLEYSEENIPWRLLVNEQRISSTLTSPMVTHKLIESVEALKPFGMGNPKPQFVFENLKVDDYKVIGKTMNHLKIMVNDGVRVYDALAFNQADKASLFSKNEALNLLLTLEKNEFRGVETIQFLVQDFVKAHMPFKSLVFYRTHQAIVNALSTGDCYGLLPTHRRLESLEEALPSKLVLIFDYKILEEIKDTFLMNQRLDYAIHFGEISKLDWIEDGINFIFLPRQEIANQNENAFYMGDLSSISDYIPNREELVQIYKWITQVTLVTLESLEVKLKMPFAKILCALSLLNEMKLLSYQIQNDVIKIALGERPKEKIDIQNLELYQKFMAFAKMK